MHLPVYGTVTEIVGCIVLLGNTLFIVTLMLVGTEIDPLADNSSVDLLENRETDNSLLLENGDNDMLVHAEVVGINLLGVCDGVLENDGAISELKEILAGSCDNVALD